MAARSKGFKNAIENLMEELKHFCSENVDILYVYLTNDDLICLINSESLIFVNYLHSRLFDFSQFDKYSKKLKRNENKQICEAKYIKFTCQWTSTVLKSIISFL